MLTQSLYNSSAEHSLAGGYTAGYSPALAKPIPTSLYGQLSPAFNRPYDCSLFAAYYSPRPFEEIGAGKLNFYASSPPSPSHYYSAVLPRTPPLIRSPPTAAPLTAASPFYASVGTIGEFYGSSPAGDSQRTTSVIMKVEHQKVSEINAKDFRGRSSSESEDEIIICKWTNCYR